MHTNENGQWIKFLCGSCGDPMGMAQMDERAFPSVLDTLTLAIDIMRAHALRTDCPCESAKAVKIDRFEAALLKASKNTKKVFDRGDGSMN